MNLKFQVGIRAKIRVVQISFIHRKLQIAKQQNTYIKQQNSKQHIAKHPSKSPSILQTHTKQSQIKTYKSQIGKSQIIVSNNKSPCQTLPKHPNQNKQTKKSAIEERPINQRRRM